MAFTRKVYSAANTETFAEDLRTALENTELFDSVTRSTVVVTGVKNGVDVLTVDLASQTPVITKNTEGTTLSVMGLGNDGAGYNSLGSYASINTDNNFVYCIFTNSNTRTGSQSNYFNTRSITFGVFKTDHNNVAFTVTTCFNNTNTLYPPTNTAISSSVAFSSDDTMTAFMLPASYSGGCIESYSLATMATDGTVDKLVNAFGIVCTSQVFTIARTAEGVTPAIITLEGANYLTDGIVLVRIVE